MLQIGLNYNEVTVSGAFSKSKSSVNWGDSMSGNPKTHIYFDASRSLPNHTADEVRPYSFTALPLIAY